MLAIIPSMARPAARRSEPPTNMARIPTRRAMWGAVVESGIITAAIGSRPSAACMAE